MLYRVQIDVEHVSTKKYLHQVAHTVQCVDTAEFLARSEKESEGRRMASGQTGDGFQPPNFSGLEE